VRNHGGISIATATGAGRDASACVYVGEETYYVAGRGDDGS
jgi:hypothetical protein